MGPAADARNWIQVPTGTNYQYDAVSMTNDASDSVRIQSRGR